MPIHVEDGRGSLIRDVGVWALLLLLLVRAFLYRVRLQIERELFEVAEGAERLGRLRVRAGHPEGTFLLVEKVVPQDDVFQ